MINIEEKITSDNRKYVQGEATIKVDQEYKGELTENEVELCFCCEDESQKAFYSNKKPFKGFYKRYEI